MIGQMTCYFVLWMDKKKTNIKLSSSVQTLFSSYFQNTLCKLVSVTKLSSSAILLSISVTFVLT